MSATYNGRELSIYEEVAMHIKDGDVFCAVLAADPDMTVERFWEMTESPAPGSDLPRIFCMKALWDGKLAVEATERKRERERCRAEGIGYYT